MDSQKFREMQIEEIKKYRWILSEYCNRDMHGFAEREWVEKYAKSYREFIESTYGTIEQESCEPSP